jgi:ParB family transcriptional regulator, chromosome partitioning protein
MAKQVPSILGAFQGAKAAQENATLRDRIAQLEAEKQVSRPEQLPLLAEPEAEIRIEAMTADIVSELVDLGGVQELEISRIFPDPHQPRKTFTEDIIQERVESLRQFGQKAPIIVIPQADGTFKLFDGEVRWRSASRLNWKTLKSVLLPESEVPSADEIFEGQMITGIHSQRLHDLDLAEGLIYLGTRRFDSLRQRSSDLPKILNTVVRRLDRDKKLPELADLRVAPPRVQEEWLTAIEFKDDAERDLFSLIFRYKLNPATVNSHVLPLLKLFPDIKAAIRQDGLESSKAREVNRLSPDRLDTSDDSALAMRQGLTQKVVSQKLSLSEVKQAVHQLIEQHNPTQSNRNKTASAQLASTLKNTVIDMDQPDDLKILLKALQAKITEVKGLLV